MPHIISHTFLFLLFLPLIASTFFSLSHGQPTPQVQGMIINDDEYNIVSWGMRRYLVEGKNSDHAGNNSLILAAKRTHRKDPLRHFKYYKGGWNISEKHYFSSVGYTAAPLFVIDSIWFLGFGLCLLIICLRHCCCQRRSYGYSQTAYALSLIFLILFTSAAIIGCIVLYTGQGKFHSSTTNTLKYVVNQADTIVQKLKNVTYNLAAAKGIGVDQIFLPPNVMHNIDRIDNKINSSATTLEEKTQKNSKEIKSGLNSVRVYLIVIAAVMLLLAFSGFLLSVFGMQFFVYILVVIGWILVTVTFILCGLFLILHNVAGDTCVAMDEWVQHPTARTALNDVLPCVDSVTAQETLSQSKDVVFQMVGIVNWFITSVCNKDFTPQSGISRYNQSGPLVPLLCNPYNSDKTDRKCDAGELDSINAAKEWKTYVCQVSESGICTTVGRLTPTFYDNIVAAGNVSYALYNYSPFLVQLRDCTFVRETFSVIIKDHCPSLRCYSKWIYIGLVMVSVAVMLSLIFWVLYARERRHRVYGKNFVVLSAQDTSGGERAIQSLYSY